MEESKGLGSTGATVVVVLVAAGAVWTVFVVVISSGCL